VRERSTPQFLTSRGYVIHARYLERTERSSPHDGNSRTEQRSRDDGFTTGVVSVFVRDRVVDLYVRGEDLMC
jgi:hypothetical protein